MVRSLLVALLICSACSQAPGGAVPADVVDGTSLDAAPGIDTAPRDLPEVIPVNGWMLLDPDPEAVIASIEAAALYGVNHIQLSHALIDEIDQVLGEDPETLQRVEILNLAIDRAHDHGMKVYVWAHEFTGGAMEVCFDPEDPFWQGRADAYRAALERLPGLDGVIMMFGSATPPPWLSICMCAWCLEGYEGFPLSIPPPEERLRMVVERIGGAIVGEGRELFVRTFVHEPAEIGWHSEGLSAAEGISFTGMHKGPVQDWQPYNPHHPCTGNIGDHPGILELDVAGEYFGLSVLPWAAPGYYRYRLNHLWESGGMGAVLRVQRGDFHALGTPNEINMLAVRRFVEDHHTPLDAVWEEFLTTRYGVSPGTPAFDGLRRILEDTFPVRRKSHYALGIWALEKSSDLPDGLILDQFTGRGKMPKWDPDWQEVWDRLDVPDEEVVRWLWQEGTEAVVLAEEGLARFADVEGALEPADAADLTRRLNHQLLAARAWRAVDLYIWGTRAQSNPDGPFPPIDAWRAWAWAELVAVEEDMLAADLAGVTPAGPARVQALVDSLAAGVPETAPSPPEGLIFSPIHVEDVTTTTATLRLRASQDAAIHVDYGLEIPDYGWSVDVNLVGGEDAVVVLEDLTPDDRWVVRLRGAESGRVVLGGDFWIFTDAE